MNNRFIPNILRNPLIQNEISKTGFAVLNADILDETNRLLQFIQASYTPSPSYFNYSLMECSYEENKTILRTFRGILHDFYAKTFTDYRTLNESFLIKPAQNPEELLLHQDWCYTDEKQFTAYNIWIPLSDVTEQNGAMFFLPGSHLWFDNYRSASLPTSRISIKNFSKQQVSKIELTKGQVLIFHPAVFHGSYPNLTAQNRIIVAATVMAHDAPFLYYHQEKDLGETEVYLLNEDIFQRQLHKISTMQHKPDAPVVKRITYLHHMVTEKELIEKSLNVTTYDQ